MDELLYHASQLAAQPATPLIAPIKGRVAYVVSHGQSYASNGYAIRTQGIARALNEHGLETLCFVRPGRPWELEGWRGEIAPETNIGGVRYIHSAWPGSETNVGGPGGIAGGEPGDEKQHLEASVARFIELFRVYRPSVVLAASNYIVGLPAWIAARRLGLPFYNEVRGFWELSRDAREPGYADSAAGRKEATRDAFVAKQAEKVFTLNQSMKGELTRRGVSNECIDIVPIGVDLNPKLMHPDAFLKRKLGIKEDEKVVGYFGTFNSYEGLDDLIEACGQLVAQGIRLKLLLIGSETSLVSGNTGLATIGNFPNFSEWLISIHRVPHSEIIKYYSVLDILVIPRNNHPVCRLVQPTKFLEAVSQNIPTLLPAYCEDAVGDCLDSVFFYKSESLASALRKVLPYTECGKYNDDKSEILGIVHKVVPIVEQIIKSPLEKSEFLAEYDSISKEKVCSKKEKELRAYIEDLRSRGEISKALAISKKLYHITGSWYSFKSYIKSLFYAQKYNTLIDRCNNYGDIGKELDVFKEKSKGYLSLFDEYFDCFYIGVKEKKAPLSKKSIYFLHSSLPYFSGGYATRAQGLARSLLDRGLDVKAYTRPNFPYDVKKGLTQEPESVKVDRVVYSKTSCSAVRLKNEGSYMRECLDVFSDILDKENPGYVHGRSTYQIAFPALIAAKKKNIPFIYEISGLWEVVHESRSTALQRKYETEKMRHLETMTAKKSDVVFTLTEAMKEELISRGVESHKIEILPNSTNPDKFLPQKKSRSLLDELGIPKDTPVIGYIGSFQDYEGLDDLIDACSLLFERDPHMDFRLLLVGDGPYFEKICQKASGSSISKKILITGRVSHSIAEKYYSIVDIAPFPRKAWPVCEMVSPMKPLEALAMEKAVIVSSVKALSEMVIEDVTGVIFQKGSIEHLYFSLSTLIKSEEKRKLLGQNARDWVVSNRNWQKIANTFESKIMKDVYFQ
ncbi:MULTISPECIES: glycosyltransferase [unclassified Halomonas]|uniref:glycosyltransferase n=1 Tax=unclassified Halomonas TaxID=2609666 RepID=UPI001C94A890|nr:MULTISPECIES: glycosyltransferase [unclassified Halomonas]MBY5924886.1 glycosyltransferase [Halomonas sp. DP4Y7-2]MBY6231928.1 glycosyltransferase [Halomonas sp. DP4Y7-1]